MNTCCLWSRGYLWHSNYLDVGFVGVAWNWQIFLGDVMNLIGPRVANCLRSVDVIQNRASWFDARTRGFLAGLIWNS